MAELDLKVWLHPYMQIPFAFGETAFRVPGDMLIVDLMDEVEMKFEEESTKAGASVDLEINVLWNTKDHKKALNPNDAIKAHFESGDTFGVYGDIVPSRPKAAPPKPEEDKLPVTILTGFLGSGKTTLLNYILKEQQDKKIAIIENEFGEISIDDALLSQGEKVSMAEKIVVMDNGCMCCTIRGDLEKGLLGILDDIQKGQKIDAIMIETTGMADPVPIVRTFMSNPELTQDMRLDAVVTMADSKHLIGRLDDKVEEGKVNEAYQQIAFADKIILNKLDLIDAEQAMAVKDRIRTINKFAKILPAMRGRVRVRELFDIRAHDMVNFVNQDIEKEAEVAEDLKKEAEVMATQEGHGGGDGGHGGGHGEDDGHGGGHGGGHGTAHGSAHGAAHGSAHGSAHGQRGENRHDARVNSFAIVREGEVLPQRLSLWMQSLGQLPPDKGTIFRIKAILAVKKHPYKHVFHAVMDVSEEDDAGLWEEGEKRVSKIVFIGKSMDQAFLRAGFEAIFG